MRSIALIILLLFSVSQKVQAQFNRLGFEPFGGYHFASNLIDKSGLSMNGYCGGFDLKYFYNQNYQSSFNEIYHQPDLSLNLRLCKLNNTDTFGYSFAIFPQIEIPVLKNSRFCLSAKMGYGINLNTRQYDSLNNFDNRAISSPVNFALDAGLHLQYRLNKNNELGISTGLYHVSNGSLKMPNGGINVIYTALTFRHQNQNYLEKKYRKIQYHTIEKSVFNYRIYGGLGYREIGYFSNTKAFWVGSLSQQFMKKISSLYQIGLSADIFFDPSPSIWENENRDLSSISTKEKIHAGIGLYQEFDLGKFYMPFSANYYINQVKKPFYIKFGLAYHISKNWFIGGFFKGGIVNGSKLESDFMEWSIGYSILK